jgi:sugar lactone lactonase YvrE
VYVSDGNAGRVVAVTADDEVRPLAEDTFTGSLAAGPDGTVYFVDQDTGRIRAVSPDGETRTVAGGGSAEPADGEPAGDSTLTGSALAAADDGLYVLNDNTVWRIDDDGRLGLVLRRGDDAALAGLAAAGDRVYIFDEAAGTISAIELAA